MRAPGAGWVSRSGHRKGKRHSGRLPVGVSFAGNADRQAARGDRGSRARGGRATLRGAAVPARMSGLTTTSGVVWRALTRPFGAPAPHALAGPRGAREGGCLGGGALGATRPPRATRYLPPDPGPHHARAASTDAPVGV